MSADNGYILRKRTDGACVIHQYFASDDAYPAVDSYPQYAGSTMEGAVTAYENDMPYSEYGLTISLNDPKKEDIPLVKLTNYTRRPFSVDAIQVTDKNIVEVSALCGGTIPGAYGDAPLYIQVPVKKPANPGQTQARVGDWVVYYQRGWKVYKDKAFKTTFQDTVGVASDLEGFARREAAH